MSYITTGHCLLYQVSLGMTPCDLSSQFTNARLTVSLHDTFKIISALTPDISHRSFSATRDAAIDSLVVPGCPEHTELNLKQIFSFYTKWGIWNIPWGKFCLEMLWRNVSITSSWPAATVGWPLHSLCLRWTVLHVWQIMSLVWFFKPNSKLLFIE